MVIFNSYVSLPEGRLSCAFVLFYKIELNWQNQTEAQLSRFWSDSAFMHVTFGAT